MTSNIKGTESPVQTPQLIPIEKEAAFRFACNSQVPCFNHCCRDLNQALTPYDVLRLKSHIGITTRNFIAAYGSMYIGAETGLPVVSLRFAGDRERNCPFVTPEGCRVYPARPSSCRLYPLARALRRIRADGRTSEHFAICQEPHCRGFEQSATQTVQQWLHDQGMEDYNAMNDRLIALIALKNQVRPGALSPKHRQMVQMAFYDVETLTQQALEGQLPGMDNDQLRPLPDAEDEVAWLIWGFSWLKHILFGKGGRL